MNNKTNNFKEILLVIISIAVIIFGFVTTSFASDIKVLEASKNSLADENLILQNKITSLEAQIKELPSSQNGSFNFETIHNYLVSGHYLEANNTAFHNLILRDGSGNLKRYDFWAIYANTLGIEDLDLSTTFMMVGDKFTFQVPTQITKWNVKVINVTSDEWTGTAECEVVGQETLTDFSFYVYLDGVKYSEIPEIDFSTIDRPVWVYNELTKEVSYFYMTPDYILSQDYAVSDFN